MDKYENEEGEGRVSFNVGLHGDRGGTKLDRYIDSAYSTWRLSERR